MPIQVNLYHRLDEDEGPMARHVAKYLNVTELNLVDGVLYSTSNGEDIRPNLPFKIITTR